MHIVMVIGGGLLLLGIFLLFGKLWSVGSSEIGTAAMLYIPVWLVVSIVNLWVGVSRAGYALREELPILLLVFAVPALAAGFALWQISRS